MKASFFEDEKEIKNDQITLLSIFSVVGCIISLCQSIGIWFLWIIMIATPIISAISIIIFAIVIWKSITIKYFNKVHLVSILLGVSAIIYNILMWMKHWPPFTEP